MHRHLGARALRPVRLAALAGGAWLAIGCAMPAYAADPADIPINGSRVFPESITSDAAGNIYVGSTGGTIYRAVAGGASAEPWIAPSAGNGLTSLFGVLADDTRGLLWVCNNPPLGGPPQPGAKSALKAFDLATGALKASYDLPGEGPFACNDIAVARDGTTFATETAGGRIFALAPDGKELTLFAKDPELVGVDGIAFAEDGTMYVNNVRKQTLLRVNRNGFDFASLTALTLSQPINGPDGLRPVSGNRFLQAEGPGGRVTYVDIAGDSATITAIRTGLESSPGVTRVGSIGYATEGKIGYLFDPALRDKDPGAFVIRAFPLP
jgi:sugar lactone lactonase YvrE